MTNDKPTTSLTADEIAAACEPFAVLVHHETRTVQLHRLDAVATLNPLLDSGRYVCFPLRPPAVPDAAAKLFGKETDAPLDRLLARLSACEAYGLHTRTMLNKLSEETAALTNELWNLAGRLPKVAS